MTIDTLDIVANSWSSVAINEDLTYYSAVALGGNHVLLVGSTGQGGAATRTIFRYDHQSKTVSPVGQTTIVRRRPGLAKVGNTIYVFGGEDSAGLPINSVETFVNGASNLVGGATLPFVGGDAAVVSGGKVFVHGMSGNSEQWCLFNPISKTFGAVSPIPSGGATTVRVASFNFGVIAIPESMGMSVLELNLTTNQWSTLFNPASPGRVGISLATTSRGVFLTGGYRNKLGGDTKYCDQIYLKPLSASPVIR